MFFVDGNPTPMFVASLFTKESGFIMPPVLDSNIVLSAPLQDLPVECSRCVESRVKARNRVRKYRAKLKEGVK